jgi:DnaJ-class molecular chaperone
MIAPEAPTEELVARRSIGGSIVSLAGKYIKDVLTKKRCIECSGSGKRKCSQCHGEGLVAGEGSSAPKELCRRCIGTGHEDCQACEGAGVVAAIPVFAH